MRSGYKIWSENLKERDCLGDVGVQGVDWFIWLGTGPEGGNESSGFTNCATISFWIRNVLYGDSNIFFFRSSWKCISTHQTGLQHTRYSNIWKCEDNRKQCSARWCVPTRTGDRCQLQFIRTKLGRTTLATVKKHLNVLPPSPIADCQLYRLTQNTQAGGINKRQKSEERRWKGRRPSHVWEHRGPGLHTHNVLYRASWRRTSGTKSNCSSRVRKVVTLYLSTDNLNHQSCIQETVSSSWVHGAVQ
jgi:hypothetical protein